jgi:ABC-type cobalamin transport system permease subunit
MQLGVFTQCRQVYWVEGGGGGVKQMDGCQKMVLVPPMLYMVLSLSAVPLSAHCTNYPLQNNPKSFSI